MSDDWDDDEWDDEDYDYDTSDDDDTIECPNCKSEIYHDTEQCPECGDYITGANSPSHKKPVWVIVIAVILVILFLIQGLSF